MTSLKPYLIRSIYEWIVDNDLTPHLLVDAENTDAVLPQEFIEDGKIVLNIKPQAIQGLSLGNDFIEFNARFSGKPLHIVTPVTAVLAIYARENGKGMVFDREDDDNGNEPPPEKKPVASKPHLRVVK
ncbi:MAG: ClpXP protease specificity-enhancing factor [Methylococcaceae bacterium]|nr:ClpXP protease specificity-enhancing factor [Methylococcaceae bacterium]